MSRTIISKDPQLENASEKSDDERVYEVITEVPAGKSPVTPMI